MDWEGYDLAEFEPVWDVIRAGDVPVMGFCGGHQFIALAFGAECGPLGPLAPGEVDLMPEYQPGMRKERGYQPLHVLAHDDPLFDGFPESGPVIMQSHYWEICELPTGFDLLASTNWCRIQVIKHRTLPIYGSQGHAEAYTDQYPDGKRLIRNFALATGVIDSNHEPCVSFYPRPALRRSAGGRHPAGAALSAGFDRDGGGRLRDRYLAPDPRSRGAAFRRGIRTRRAADVGWAARESTGRGAGGRIDDRQPGLPRRARADQRSRGRGDSAVAAGADGRGRGRESARVSHGARVGLRDRDAGGDRAARDRLRFSQFRRVGGDSAAPPWARAG